VEKGKLFYPGWKAMILAAGFGTRLRPLTDRLPKPLVPVAGLPMLAFNLRRMRALQPATLVVNGHYRARELEAFLLTSAYGLRRVIFLHESRLLDTGGALLNAAPYLKGPFFVTMNADVLSDIELVGALAQHLRRRALVTMLLHDCPRYNQVEIDTQSRLLGFGCSANSGAETVLAYTGIQICSPLLLDLLVREKAGSAFSLISFYRRLLASGRRDLMGYRVDCGTRYYWRDLGTPEDLSAVERDLSLNAGLKRRLGGG